MTAAMAESVGTLDAGKKQFDREGFTVLRQFIPRDYVAGLEIELQRYIREDLPKNPNAAFLEDKADIRSLFRLDKLADNNPYFDRMRREKQFIELAATLLDDDVDPRGVQMFGKAPRIGNETPPHQDGFYFMLEPNQALTMWLPLDRTDRDNGCIRYVSGSHKRGVQPHGKSSVFGFSLGLLDFNDEDRKVEVAVEADPGDLIVHHSLTYHRADRNLSDRRRWAIGLTYYAASAKVDEARREAHTKAVHSEWQTTGKI